MVYVRYLTKVITRYNGPNDTLNWVWIVRIYSAKMGLFVHHIFSDTGWIEVRSIGCSTASSSTCYWGPAAPYD
uniref:Uncharacterized protein n=1 Tax=Rhizophora mucronata TaxID=61149 RepID=A0A2P2JNV6_RHIMU